MNKYALSSALKKPFSPSFSGLAVLIFDFGVYWLSDIRYAQRTREIGIRKVMGERQESILLF